MPRPIYNWKRFWCPWGESISLSFGGYLYDPESEWGRYSNPNVKPFGAIADTPCLVLLGEPGIGKTHASISEWKAIEAKAEQGGDSTLWLDLRSYGSEDRLVRNLFESQKFCSWREGDNRLHLFLDSLDEGLLQIRVLASLLAEEFRKYPVDRLFLRIACRTAEWPSSLEAQLQALWGEQVVGVYELAPLRRVDIIEAARTNNVEPDGFLSEVERAEVVPLAIKPVTLDFLLKAYQSHGSLPKTQAELYLEGCHLLCEETNPDRRDARLKEALSADQRMAVAARIAAITVFANRYAVWTTIDQGDVPTEDVTVRELSGWREQARGNEFEVGEDAIKEALGTGLFSARGPNRLGWVHRTYAEFLAAYYLVQHQMSLRQLMSLVVHPGDVEGKLIPQLHETAAWLAGMTQEVFREILKTDPEVLLRSDVATAAEADRAALVQALLEKCDAEQSLLYHDQDVFAWFKKLTHADLAAQLRPYACDSAKSQLARSVAIDIAEACQLRDLENELVQLALDQSQPLRIRKGAAHAVVRMGTNEAWAKLKPLALGEAGDDPDDELKGYSLQAVWPAHLTVEELFPLITLPKTGRDNTFLWSELATHLQAKDLPVALKWAEDHDPKQTHYHPFEKLIDTIMLQAWGCLETPGVLEAFARVAWLRVNHYENILGEPSEPEVKEAFSNDERRRKVVEAILSLMEGTKKDVSLLCYSRPSLVLNKDMSWMIERLHVVTSEELKHIWAWLIERMINWQDPEQIDVVLTACQEEPILAEACARDFKPVSLDSPQAREMKEKYLEELRWQEKRENRLLPAPTPAERIERLLTECESINSVAWWRLNREMTLEPDSIHYGDELESDLTTLPGWKAAHPTTRGRIIEAAKKYLLEQDPHTSHWLGKDVYDHPALAGYRALRLLWQIEPEWISSLAVETWRKWSPIILAYPTTWSRDEEEEIQRTLVSQAYRHAPEEIGQTLLSLVDEENERHGTIFVLRKIALCWDDYLKSVLLMKVKEEKLRPEALGQLLRALLDQKVEGARNFATSVVHLSSSADADQRGKAITAACLLMTHTEDAGWPIVWPIIQQDVEFGQKVIIAVAYEVDIEQVNLSERLTENQLASLYVWMVRPRQDAEELHLDDDSWSGVGAAGLKGSLLEQLKRRGTPQACEAIRQIMRELPELEWLKWTFLEAQSITRRQTWLPPKPEDILALISDQRKRLVQSGEQLLDVLVVSLQRLEEDLQGETPQVEFLWDRPQGICRPKDENAFSNYVKSHLERDLKQRGIIVNREVEIRRSMGGSPGERVDIQVDAVSKRAGTEEYDRISAVIEVKGCWHGELRHAMKTQLVDRYLTEAHCQHGLYLVGWFDCGQWDDTDSRKRSVPKSGIEEARKQFDAQAKELSRAGVEIRAFVMNTVLR